MIIRTEKRDKWVSIEKATLEDDRLSFRARGLLAYLLTKPDHWQVYENQLVKASVPDGRTAVRKTLRELEAAGYIVRSQGHRDSGQFDTPDVQVFESPQVSTADGKPVNGRDQGECTKPQVGTADGFAVDGSAVDGESTTSKEGLKQVLTEVKTDSLFAAVADVCHIDAAAITISARESIEKAVKELHAVGATADEIRQRAMTITAGWRDGRLTPKSLVAHWAQGNVDPWPHDPIYTESTWDRPRRPQCGVCDGSGFIPEPDDGNGVSSVRQCVCRTGVHRGEEQTNFSGVA